MSKLISFFVFLFIGSTLLGAIMEGGGGVIAIELSTTIDSDDTTVQVADTTGFLSVDYVVIGNEKISYTGTTATSFTGCTRGYDGTTATAHIAGSMVYTEGASVVNSAMGYNIAATADSMGWWAVITIPFKFLTTTLPHIISMNYAFLYGDMALIGIFFYASGAGLVITFAMQLAGGRRI